ncbi:MAG: transposase [Actinomycetota bacterium]
MLYAAIDIHKHAFQAAVLDPESGEVVEQRFSADRDSLARWAEQWRGRVAAVAIEATTGWRWVWRELVDRGFEVRLAEPVQTRALLGRRRSAKTDRLDARVACTPAGEGDAARVVDPAGADPRAARPHAAA